MNINKSIIDQRITKIIADNLVWFSDEKIINDHTKKISKAFLMLSVASYLDIELEETFAYLTDESNDSGIDAVYIGDITDIDFTIILFQSKYYTGKKMENDANFEENAIVKILYALQLIFDNQAQITINEKLKAKIAEIQDLAYNSFLIPQVKCVMLSNGIKWNTIAQQKIDNYIQHNKYVEFDFFNHDNILNYIQSNKNIKADLKLNGKALTETLPNFKRVLVGKINVVELANLLELHGDGLLGRNIRKYLGIQKNKVNQQIKETLLSDKKENFYLYNNGLTMICNTFRENGFANDWIVKADELQIINGGQTCKTIQKTIEEYPNNDYSKAFVMIRLYEIDKEDKQIIIDMFRLYEIDKEDEQIITNIIVSTNSQSPVDLRDLKANDLIQKTLEIGMLDLGYVYKRKRENIFQSIQAISSSVAAEAILTIWRELPIVAKYKKNNLFDNYYEKIFTNINASQTIIAVLIFRFCDNQRRKENLVKMYQYLPYSNYLMATLMGKLLLKQNNLQLNELNHKNFETIKNYYEENKQSLFEKANQIMIDILKNEYETPYNQIEQTKLAAFFRKNETVVACINKINY